MTESWAYGEKKCVLCDRFGYPTDYYEPNFEGTEPTAVIPLCQYHKASYMSHGIKRLDKLYREMKRMEKLDQELISKAPIGVYDLDDDEALFRLYQLEKQGVLKSSLEARQGRTERVFYLVQRSRGTEPKVKT